MGDAELVKRLRDREVVRCVAGLEMRNVFPFVATLPADLWSRIDRMPPTDFDGHMDRNRNAILACACAPDATVIVAWGSLPERARIDAVETVRLLTLYGVPLLCLGTTKDGSPRHPSRLGYAVQPEPWRAPA